MARPWHHEFNLLANEDKHFCRNAPSSEQYRLTAVGARHAAGLVIYWTEHWYQVIPRFSWEPARAFASLFLSRVSRRHVTAKMTQNCEYTSWKK